MSSPTPFQTQFPHLPPPREPASSGGSPLVVTLALLGGGILLFGFLGVLVAVWMLLSGPRFVPDQLWEEHLAWVIETSVMPQRERTAVMKDVKRLARACDPEKMSSSQLEETLTALESAPVFVLLDVGGIERDVVSASGLSDAEKEQGRSTVVRAARGVHAGKIASADFYGALPTGYFYPTRLTVALTEEELAEYNSQFPAERPQASDDDVQAALARLAAMADEAGMPDENWKYDLSDEFAKAVSAALAGNAERRRD